MLWHKKADTLVGDVNGGFWDVVYALVAFLIDLLIIKDCKDYHASITLCTEWSFGLGIPSFEKGWSQLQTPLMYLWLSRKLWKWGQMEYTRIVLLVAEDHPSNCKIISISKKIQLKNEKFLFLLTIHVKIYCLSSSLHFLTLIDSFKFCTAHLKSNNLWFTCKRSNSNTCPRIR